MLVNRNRITITFQSPDKMNDTKNITVVPLSECRLLCQINRKKAIYYYFVENINDFVVVGIDIGLFSYKIQYYKSIIGVIELLENSNKLIYLAIEPLKEIARTQKFNLVHGDLYDAKCKRR